MPPQNSSSSSGFLTLRGVEAAASPDSGCFGACYIPRTREPARRVKRRLRVDFLLTVSSAATTHRGCPRVRSRRAARHRGATGAAAAAPGAPRAGLDRRARRRIPRGRGLHGRVAASRPEPGASRRRHPGPRVRGCVPARFRDRDGIGGADRADLRPDAVRAADRPRSARGRGRDGARQPPRVRCAASFASRASPVRIVNAWYSLGPALVLGLAGERCAAALGLAALRRWP